MNDFEVFPLNFDERAADGTKIWTENGEIMPTIARQEDIIANVEICREFDARYDLIDDKQKLLDFCKTLSDEMKRPTLNHPKARILLFKFANDYAALINGLGRDAGKL